MLLLAKRRLLLLFLFGLLGFGLLSLNGCAKKTTQPDPIIIETPDLGELANFTNKVTISFKFYDATGDIEKVTCRFTWTADKRMTGPCGKVPPGVYVYKLEYREQGSNVLLARASAKVEIAKNNEVVIKPVLDFNIKDNSNNQTNLAVFIAGVNGSGNSVPIAKAGSNQSIKLGSQVSLDGSKSNDVDNDTLTFRWTLTSNPADSTATLIDTTSPSPTITPDVIGAYQVTLVVNDGTEDSVPEEVTITVTAADDPNLPPSADVGANAEVTSGDSVTLNGEKSRDSDGNIVSYRWESKESTIRLSSANTAITTFTAPTVNVPQTYNFELTVTDNEGASATDTVVITVIPRNEAPTAKAGVDQNASVGETVVLDASASSDPNKDTLSYEWMTPSGVSLSSTSAVKPSFTVATGTKAGVLTFDVVVSDGQGGTASESVEITILNTAPSAIAGSDRNGVINTQVNLDGSASLDVNGDTLNYGWSVLTAPSGSTATLVDPTLAKARFTPDVVGDYTVQLEVKDSLDSAMDSLVLMVIEAGRMMALPGGSFQMGDETSSDGTREGAGHSTEVPVHTVTVAAFEMGKYEVTFAEYDEYLKNRTTNPISDPSTIPIGSFDEAADEGWGRDLRPAIWVSWNDIQGYLEWLNAQQGIALDDAKRYRLPTEAEWEYAARGGTMTAYSTGDCIDTSQANYNGDSYSYTKKDGMTVDCPKTDLNRKKTEFVGSFAANPFGLHDMHGNVAEWVEDCWSYSYTGASLDGSAWWIANCGYSRPSRGGSWLGGLFWLRSASRDSDIDARYFSNGFRLARTL